MDRVPSTWSSSTGSWRTYWNERRRRKTNVSSAPTTRYTSTFKSYSLDGLFNIQSKAADPCEFHTFQLLLIRRPRDNAIVLFYTWSSARISMKKYKFSIICIKRQRALASVGVWNTDNSIIFMFVFIVITLIVNCNITVWVHSITPNCFIYIFFFRF